MNTRNIRWQKIIIVQEENPRPSWIFRDARILKKFHTVKLAFRIFGFKMQPQATSCVNLPVHNKFVTYCSDGD